MLQLLTRWGVLFICWANFDHYRLTGEVPPKYFWVRVATCPHCGGSVNVSWGAHKHKRDVRSAMMFHFDRCPKIVGTGRSPIKLKMVERISAVTVEAKARP